MFSLFNSKGKSTFYYNFKLFHLLTSSLNIAYSLPPNPNLLPLGEKEFINSRWQWKGWGNPFLLDGIALRAPTYLPAHVAG